MELEHNHVVPVVVGLATGAVEQLTWPILHVVLPVLSDKWKRVWSLGDPRPGGYFLQGWV